MTRSVGIVLVIVAIVACVAIGGFLGIGLASGNLSAGGAALGGLLTLLFVVAPLGGFGAIVLVRSREDDAEQSESEDLRRILDMVQARGVVDLSDVIIELQSDLPTVKDMVYRLVGMGVFSGYINWDEGKLYSSEASALHQLDQCRHCGGKVSFAGKGVMACPFCGTEYFLAI